MGLVDRIARRLGFKSVSFDRPASAHSSALWLPGLSSMSMDYRGLAKDTYLVNAIGFKCLKLTAVAAAQIKIDLVEKKSRKIIEDHPIIDLVNRPSPLVSKAHFFERLYSFTRLAGNAYVHAAGPNAPDAQPNELWCLRPDYMRVDKGGFGLPRGYTHIYEGRETHWPMSAMGDCDILHIKEFHPLDDLYGLSRTEPGAYGIRRHNMASKHNYSLLLNGARPSGALVFKPIKDEDGDFVSAPKEILEAAEQELVNRHQSPENSGKPLVLSGDVDWEEMAISPKDMDFLKGKEDAAADICAAWSVPQVLVLPGDLTYNNIREARLEFYEETVIPLAQHTIREFNHWLVPKFGDENIMFTLDLDSIISLELRRDAKRNSVIKLLEAGILSLEEARRELGYEDEMLDSESIVGIVDGPTITALINAANLVGIEPLRRYMLSRRLIDKTVTAEQLMAMALNLTGGEDDDFEE